MDFGAGEWEVVLLVVKVYDLRDEMDLLKTGVVILWKNPGLSMAKER